MTEDTSPPDGGNLVIRASAGTGKTFQLSNRFLDLLARGVAVDRILATTFTRKAAGEILARVLFRLARAATDDASRTQLASAIERAALTREQCLGLLQQAVQHLHRMRVGTLDSFFAQIAGTFSLELGLPPAWRICDELEDERLRSEAVERVLGSRDLQDLLRLTHLLTKGEARRGVHQLVRSCVDSLYGLFLETQEEAWHQIPQPKPLTGPELAAALDELRNLPLPADKRFATARDTDCRRATTGDWEEFITKGFARPVLDGTLKYYGKPIPDDVVSVYERLLQHAKAEIVGRIARQTAGTYELLQKFDRYYQQFKTTRGALRFEDVTHYLSERELAGGVDRLAFRLDSGVDHLLLDEFQDTSLAQWQVVRPFAGRVTSLPDRSFFCVGDIKQAIYGWRGGIAEIFEALPKQLTGLSFGSLNKSYRSAPPIIDAVNATFTGMGRHKTLERADPEVQRWSRQFEPHSTARTELAGYVCLQTAPPPVAETEKAADTVLDLAARRVAEMTVRAPGFSIGVLVRTNAAVAKLIYLLRKLHVNASEEGGNPLTDSAAVRVVLSLLKLADHPGDTIAATHAAHSPLGRAVGLDRDADSAAAVRLAHNVRRTVLEQGYGPAVYGWSRRLAPHCNRRELNRLVQLVELAYGYQPMATLRASDFVRFVETQRVSDPTFADVRVMTVHQSKGLQFDIVMLPDLDADVIGQPDAFVVDRADPTSPVRGVCLYVNEHARQLLPESVQKTFQAATDREVGESLCVLYVAMTRAVHALHMIVAPSKPSEKKLRRTFAGLLRAALTDGRPAAADATLYQTGDPQWFAHAGDSQPAAPAAADAGAEHLGQPLEVRLAPGGHRTRGLDRMSPSGLEGGTRQRISAVFHSDEKAVAALRGTLWHYWFEHIHWLDEEIPDDDSLRQWAAELPEAAAALDLDEQIRRFRDLLARAEVADVLRRQTYRPPAGLKWKAGQLDELAAGRLTLEVQTERRFAVREDDAVLTGAIDRLVLIHRDRLLLAADITDYKTDVIAAGDRAALGQRVDYYRPQLAAYRRAVAQMTRLDSKCIAARLIFVQPGVVVDLDS